MTNAAITVVVAGLGAGLGATITGSRSRLSGALMGAAAGGLLGLVFGRPGTAWSDGVPRPPVDSPPPGPPPTSGASHQESDLPWWWFYVLELQGNRWVRVYDSGAQQRSDSGVLDWLLSTMDQYESSLIKIRAWKWGYDTRIGGYRWIES